MNVSELVNVYTYLFLRNLWNFFILKSYKVMIAIANYYGYPYDMNTTSIQLLLNIVQLNGH